MIEPLTDFLKKISWPWILLITLLFAALFFTPKAMNKGIYKKIDATFKISKDSIAIQNDLKKLEADIARNWKKINQKKPKSPYLIINTTSNEYLLLDRLDTISYGKCSTGSYVMLRNGDKQKWIFKTPKGEFTIKSKITRPVWKKPDWAFVEEGLPVPPPDHDSRFEYGVLGDYALSLGKGYLIHGTLYQRFLGLPVTHGCVRMDDESLALAYKYLDVGSKVYIY